MAGAEEEGQGQRRRGRDRGGGAEVTGKCNSYNNLATSLTNHLFSLHGRNRVTLYIFYIYLRQFL